jgi:hypothetical protein
MTEMKPRHLPSIKQKRGPLTKQEACAAVNPHMSKKSPIAMKLAIYTEATEKQSLSTRKNHLSSLPPQVLVLILLELPLDSYLDLVQTSKFLRKFLKTNAAYICNTCVLGHLALEGALIPSAKVNGWIVPTHTDFTILERYVLDKKIYHDRARQIVDEYNAYVQDLRVKLTQPSPQFLLWLQQGNFRAKFSKNNQEQLVINCFSTVRFLRWLNEDLSGYGYGDEKWLNGFTRRKLLWYHRVPEN